MAKKTPKTLDEAEAVAVARLNARGQEIPDPEPMVMPAGFRRPETLAEQVQRLVRTHISREAELAGAETFEESEDFDVDDDMEPNTPYETFFDPVLGKELTPQEFKHNEQIYRKQYLQAQQNYFRMMDRQEAIRRPSRGAGVSPAPTRQDDQKPAPEGSQTPPAAPAKG